VVLAKQISSIHKQYDEVKDKTAVSEGMAEENN
jgi:hypothetical protein